MPACGGRADHVLRKIIILLFFGNRGLLRATRLEQRDVRVVTNVEAGCDGRDGCARRAQAARTAKSCGPGLSTLRSSPWSLLDGTRGRWGQESRSPGRARRTPLKPIARGRPGLSGCTCGTCRLHSFEQAGHGPQPRSGLPRALSLFRGTRRMHHSGLTSRETARSCLVGQRRQPNPHGVVPDKRAPRAPIRDRKLQGGVRGTMVDRSRPATSAGGYGSLRKAGTTPKGAAGDTGKGGPS